MSEIRLLLYEFKRLLRVRKTWLFLTILTMVPILLCTNLFGLGNFYSGTKMDVFLLYPAKYSSFIGALTVLILLLTEMQRMVKYRMNAIIETATNPLYHQLRQTAAIVMVLLVSFLVTISVLLPFTAVGMGSTFKLFSFLACWFFIYFGSILITTLLTSGFMMITRNYDLSFILVGVLIAISFFAPRDVSFLLFWVQTNVVGLSDATKNYQVIDIILYTRLVWILFSTLVYLLGLSCVRKYGKNLIHAFLHSCKNVVVLPLLILIFTYGTFHFAYFQPFFDMGPVLKFERKVDSETGMVIYHYDDSSFVVDDSINREVAFKNGKAIITVDTRKRLLKGEITYQVRNPGGVEQDVAFTITPGLELLEIYENDKKIKFKKNRLDNHMNSVYHLKMTAEKGATLRIVYQGSPRSGRDYQWRQWGITDQFVLIPHTFPIPNNTITDVECILNLPEKLTPIMQDKILVASQSAMEGYKSYHYRSNGFEWVIAGDYHIEKIKAGDQEIQFIYLKGKEEAIKESHAVEVIEDVVDFFSEKFGPLDFKGMPFVIAELDTSFVNGGWGLGNMSVFGEALFAGTVYKGRPEAANYEGGSGIGVAVHEIAHQWWGWSPDSVYIAEDGSSPWSSEGLTVYSTYLYMKDRYGEEYAKKSFIDVWEYNSKKMKNAFYLTHLEYADKLSDNDAANIYSGYAMTTQYELMPHLLLKAQELTGGEDAFIAALRSIRNKYHGQQLFYDDFLKEMKLKKEDLTID